MLCLACASPSTGRICRACRASLRPAPERVLPSGVVVRAAFAHEGAARILVHRLKYRPVDGLAEWIADQIDVGPRRAVLVPIPRAPLRQLRTGTDPALHLARALSKRLSMPVAGLLRAPLWWRRHAGRARTDRAVVAFRRRGYVSFPLVLVDDVVTTGTTAESAIGALSGLPALVVSATSVGSMRVG